MPKDPKKNKFPLFGPEVFYDDWIIVTDRNGCDIQVTVNDLHDHPPDKDSVEIFYGGLRWWIDKDIHFPM